MASLTLWQLLNQRQPFGSDADPGAAHQQAAGQASLIGPEAPSEWPLAVVASSFGLGASTPMASSYGNVDGDSAQNLPQFAANIPANIIAPGLSMRSNENGGPAAFAWQSSMTPWDASPISQADDSGAALPSPNHPLGNAPVSAELPLSAREVDEEVMQRVLDYLKEHPGVPDNGFPSDLEMKKAQLDGALQTFDTMQPRTNTMQDRENYEYATNPAYKALFDKFDDFMKDYGNLPSGTAFLRQELKRRLHDIYSIPNYETDEPAYERDVPWIAKWKFDRQQRNNDL